MILITIFSILLFGNIGYGLDIKEVPHFSGVSIVESQWTLTLINSMVFARILILDIGKERGTEGICDHRMFDDDTFDRLSRVLLPRSLDLERDLDGE